MTTPKMTTCCPAPLIALLASCALFLAWSAVRPFAYDVWLLEIFAGLLGITVLAATWRRFRFSGLVYLLAGIHFAILAVAAKYTYREMPLFSWLRDTLELSRNHYDRVGHFAQGFVPAMIAREIILRVTPLRRGKLVTYLVLCVCLSLSAFWELLEWWVVMLFYRDAGQEWLGMQGDPWDAQWDMTLALVGAVTALATLSRVHDRSMMRLRPGEPAGQSEPN